MEPRISNFISPTDIISLKNLSEIKDHQVVDIYDNGTISAPYDRSVVAFVWRTGRWLGGLSQNREDIPKIRALMQRAMTGYINGCQEIKSQMEKAIEGLEHLKNSYKEQGKSNACNEIDKIVTYVQQNFQKKIETNELLTKDNWLHLNRLESSFIETGNVERISKGVEDSYEGVIYYKERISQFLNLERENLNVDETIFLREMHSALEGVFKIQATQEKLESLQFANDIIFPLAKRLYSEGEKDAYIKAASLEKKERWKEFIQEILNELDSLPSSSHSKEIIIPMSIKWESKGHTFFLGLCKEADGTYTAVQANAGTFALGLKNISNLNWHLNYNVSTSGNFPCVIEFSSLTRNEVEEFLLSAFENIIMVCKDKNESETKYNSLFDSINRKEDIERIPHRRGQITGNCGVRNLKELMIYSFQKDNKVELANKFFKYVDGRGSETLPFEEIKPFKEDF